MLKRVGSLLIAAATMAACSEPTVPTGTSPEIPVAAQQSVLATLSCRVDVAAQSMSCAPESPAGRSADVILGGQNTYVTLTSSSVVNNGTTITANVNVKNLTVQPWATADGTTPDTGGVKVFFHTGPTNGVTVANRDSTTTFTGPNQPYFKYSGTDLGTDGINGILASGETSANKSWVFNLNGAGTFAFQLFITTKLPDDQGVLRWTRSQLSQAGTFEEINGVWGSSSTDVWAGGTGGTTSLHHWDGSSWTASAGAETVDVLALWGTASNNVYAVGGTKIQQYNGTSWADVSSGATASLFAVWGSSATDIYAGGLNGTLVHSTGGAFTPVASTGLGTELVIAIWGTSPTDVYVGGDTFRHWDGGSWSVVTAASITDVRKIWGSSATDIWVGGTNGALRHLTGGSWVSSTLGTAPITGIWGTAANDVYLTNRSGEIYHYNGTSWVKYSGLTNTAILDLWGSGRQDLWAVGSDLTFTNNIVVHGTR
jgi:hypothetical protein